ncbi:hypothetical protein [Rhodococcus phage REQ1]|uniref:hypothetical protein n=1 Tax=Rhodococcus phage REQ1 TaxID=1109712 RepID=UPI00023EEC04|nr:hypothetical protein RoPhREQ1_gp35 [Rhodococcus phage REQ1]AEV52031.1 hypothetical protein [Rhodococcus phage REQ1]
MSDNKAFLKEMQGGKEAPPLPDVIRDEFADVPDDQTMFEFISDTLTVSVELGMSVDFAAAAIANGLLDLGFKR